MLFGCRAHDLTAPRTPDELGRACQAQGVKYIQLALAKSFPHLASGATEINLGMGAAIRRSLAAYDVEVAVMGCYFNTIDADTARREAGIDKFSSYLRCAHAFGSSIVATETGSVDPDFHYTEANFTDAVFDQAAATIERLVRVGEQTGTVVGIEPGVNHPIHDVQTCLKLVERINSPYLGFILDPTALITPKLAPQQFDITCEMLEQLAPRIVAAHLVDWRIEHDELVRVNLGEGSLDSDRIITTINHAKPEGYLITEFTENDAIGRFIAAH